MSLFLRTEKALSQVLAKIAEALKEDPSINFILENVERKEEWDGLGLTTPDDSSDVVINSVMGQLALSNGGQSYPSLRMRILN